MNIRKIDLNKDYEILTNWLLLHNKPIINKELLSDSGFIIDDIVAGFLYKTNSAVCIVENFISNPISDKNDRRIAINTLFETIIKEAKNLNFQFMFTAVQLNSLHKNLINLDFKELPNDKLMFRSL